MAATKITENIEYLTEVLTAYDGHEQRIKLRQQPRNYFNYDYSAMDQYQAQWLRGMSRIRQSDVWYIPLWNKISYLREDFVANGKALYIDNDYYYNFDECEWIEIFVKDDFLQSGINIVRQVHSYTDGIITLKKKIDRPLNMKNTWILPLKQATTKTTDAIQYLYSNGDEECLNFELILHESKVHIPNKYRYDDWEDIPQFNRFNLPKMYNDKEVFLFTPQWGGDDSNTLAIEKNTELMDNTTGTFVYDLKNTYSYDTHNFTILLFGIKRIVNMIHFFHRMQGMYKSFYCPTWANDFQVDRDISENSNYIYTRFNLLFKFYANNGRKKAIVIFTKKWESYILEITSYTTEVIGGKTFGKLILATNVPRAISKEDVLMVSYFNLVRLDSDNLKLEHESNTVATVSLAMKEVDDLV